MQKILVAVLYCVVLLSSCLETGTNTTIKEDGSGSMVATVDMGPGMTMIMAGRKWDPNEIPDMDTTIFIRHHSDTASIFTTRQKDLLREMMIKFRMDFSDAEKIVFTVTIEVPFKNLTDFNDLNTLMKEDEYDIIFDRAFKIPMLDDKEKDGENTGKDNLFGSVFPAFFKCNYAKGLVSCELDAAEYEKMKAALVAMEFDLDGDTAKKMFGAARVTNRLVLPGKPKNIKGDSWKPGEKENVLVQETALLDIYKNPGNFTYTIQY